MPGLAHLFRIKWIKIILHLQQPAAGGAVISVALRVLPQSAILFNALEISVGHASLSVVCGLLPRSRRVKSEGLNMMRRKPQLTQTANYPRLPLPHCRSALKI